MLGSLSFFLGESYLEMCRVQEVISDQSNFIFELWDVCCIKTELDNTPD